MITVRRSEREKRRLDGIDGMRHCRGVQKNAKSEIKKAQPVKDSGHDRVISGFWGGQGRSAERLWQAGQRVRAAETMKKDRAR
jgi:hypothetical protein